LYSKGSRALSYIKQILCTHKLMSCTATTAPSRCGITLAIIGKTLTQQVYSGTFCL
jgi:hypothetical protein